MLYYLHMPEIITDQEPLEHLWLDLFDSGEEVDISLAAERIVDISDICDATTIGISQTVIKYARAKRGLVAQIQDRYEDGVDSGVTIHLFPEELGVAGMVTKDYFLQRAHVLGCDVMQLAETIVEFAPSENITD